MVTRGMVSRMVRGSAALGMAAFCACSGPDGGPAQVGPEASGRQIQLVSDRLDDAEGGTPEWAHLQTVSADLDGDGGMEQVSLTAAVTSLRGRLDWQDSQQWQVYVDEPDGARTYVYKQLLNLGTLRARLSRPTPGEPPTIVLLEQLPQRLGVYEIRYRGPGAATAYELTRREYDLRSMFQGTPEP